MPDRYKVNEVFSPLKREESKKFQLPIIVYLPFLFTYLIYGNRPHDIPVIGTYFPSPTPTLISTSDIFLTSTSLFSSTLSITPTETAFHLFGYPTNTPNSDIPVGFPWIKGQGSWYESGQRVLFSYYYPPLGGTNCHEDNWVNGQCKNTTASGQGWKEYMTKGIAVHPDMLDRLPFGSMVYVVNPPQIRGYYTVVDLCGGCFINGNYYFDFLFDDMPAGLNWSVPVDFLPVRIGWDGTFPPTYTPLPPATFTGTPQPSQVPTSTPIYIVITAVPPTNTFSPTPTSTLEIPSLTPTATP